MGPGDIPGHAGGKGAKRPADNLQTQLKVIGKDRPFGNGERNVRRFNQIYFKSIPPSGEARGTQPHTSKGENDLPFSSAPFLFAIGSQQARPDKEASPLVRCFPYRRGFAVWQQNKKRNQKRVHLILETMLSFC